MIGFKKACHESGHIVTKTLRGPREAHGRAFCAHHSASGRKLLDEDVKNIFQAELLKPNSFCRRSFSVQCDGTKFSESVDIFIM